MNQDIPDRKSLLLAAQEAMRQKNWSLAVECWDACIAANQGQEVSPTWRYSRGIALVYSGRFQEATAEFAALASEHPELPHGAIGRARSAFAQNRWPEALEYWDQCIAGFASHPERPSWERTRALVLERLGKWSEALEAWQTISTEQPDLQALSGCARCAVQALGPTLEAETYIERVLRQFPDDQAVLKQYARTAYSRRDFPTASARWRACVERYPDDLQGYENAVATARQGGDARVAAELVAAAPGALASTTEFQCRVLLPLHALRHDISRGMALYRAMERSDLDWPDAAGIAQFLIETLHYAEALVFLAPMLERFPARHHLVQPYLMAVLHSRGPAFFQAEKVRLLKDFGGDGDLAIIRSLPRNHLSGPELRRLIDHVLTAEPDGPRRTRELVTILESNSVETAHYLRERLRISKSANERVFGHLLLARLSDLQKLSRAISDA
jgi:tetratricopeptide (TPR) repeat protein